MPDDVMKELRPLLVGVRKFLTLREALDHADNCDTVSFNKDDGDFWQVIPPRVYQ